MKALLNVTLAAGLLATFPLCAQTTEEIRELKKNMNRPKMEKLVLELKQNSETNKIRMNQMAKIKGWPKRKKSQEGNLMVLAGITEDGQPIYHQSLNYEASLTTRANKLYAGGGLGLNLHGESMTAAVWDVDIIRASHEAFGNRVRQMDQTITPSSVYYSSHPTHVAGTIAGSEQSQARGMAYKGNIHAYNTTDDLPEAASEAANGLLISNHSYASDGFAGAFASVYTGVARSWDELMYNAPYYLSVWACGNSGGSMDKLSNSSIHKNGISVAAVYSVPNYTGPSSVVPTSFSSRGPSDDSRIKPDISAKGASVFSSTSGNNQAYGSGSGTSFSAPNVTGTLLLLQQHYTNLNGRFMKSATLRGLALHTADEAGPAPGPDNVFGWGLLNAEKAAKTISTNGSASLIQELNLNNGNTFTKNIVSSGSNPLEVSITWTDLPGIPSMIDNDRTPKLVNDLDVRITSNGVTYLPWMLDIFNPAGPALKGDNLRDNIEKVQIKDPVPGQSYTIVVTHKNQLQSGSQNFSLVATGLAQTTPIHAKLAVPEERPVVTYDLPQPEMKSEQQEPELVIYPNPSHGIFNIKTKNLDEGFLQILDSGGREILRQKFTNQNELPIDIQSQQSGTYILRIITGEDTITQNIVKI